MTKDSTNPTAKAATEAPETIPVIRVPAVDDGGKLTVQLDKVFAGAPVHFIEMLRAHKAGSKGIAQHAIVGVLVVHPDIDPNYAMRAMEDGLAHTVAVPTKLLE